MENQRHPKSSTFFLATRLPVSPGLAHYQNRRGCECIKFTRASDSKCCYNYFNDRITLVSVPPRYYTVVLFNGSVDDFLLPTTNLWIFWFPSKLFCRSSERRPYLAVCLNLFRNAAAPTLSYVSVAASAVLWRCLSLLLCLYACMFLPASYSKCLLVLL